MSTHYATLGLPANASAPDIRQAYRRLVWLTHPDRTPDPAAHARYLAINEAYEVLRDPARRAVYDAALEWRATAPRTAPKSAPAPAPPRTGPARHPPAGYRRPSVPPTHVLYAAQFALFRPWLRAAAVLSLLLLGLLLADYMTSRLLPNETVQRFDYIKRSRRGGDQSYLVFYTERARFRTPTTIDLEPGDQVRVEQTRLLGKPRTVLVLSGKLRGQRPTVARFGFLGALGPVVALSALGVLLLRLRADHAFTLGFINCVAAGLLLGFYVF
ncbi:J domain-containing protein [Hymenobacter psychrophilus]|uniref:DnaJ domain-containing protein n=1 Tax=Hymenobacter psychrophilus TaxID=651662 RepID=A0A1H3EVY3_9BACT|nr:J domain-containing protein [Hymenobacter psychrophilus]SDX82932.1 DnaJ domain-containing protein [Hymenobacter psychrophilus]